MRPRVPLAYAGLLIIALVAVIGFAAFSPSTGSVDEGSSAATTEPQPPAEVMSARVASAVLALRVSDADNRTATTQLAAPVQAVDDVVEDEAAVSDTTESGSPSVETTVAATSPPTTDAQTTAADTQAEPLDTSPPAFRITSPDDGDTVESTFVNFTGTVEKGATVRSGPYEATVSDDGEWSIKLAVAPGANGASFTATDAAGNSASVRIVVHYDPPQTTTTKASVTTTTKAAATTTTAASSTSSSPKWSPNWPADAGGVRDVEVWRSLVEKYWAADRVDCVLGIIKKESNGNPRAYNSSTGASGLMQHLIKYWNGRAAGAGFQDSNGLYASPYSAEANIAAGAHIAGSGDGWYIPWSYVPAYGSCPGT